MIIVLSSSAGTGSADAWLGDNGRRWSPDDNADSTTGRCRSITRSRNAPWYNGQRVQTDHHKNE